MESRRLNFSISDREGNVKNDGACTVSVQVISQVNYGVRSLKFICVAVLEL
jgi:hypothetical protein